MQNFPGLRYVQERELGNPVLCLPDSIRLQSNLSVISFSNFSNSCVRPSTRNIWISGRENMTMTLNSHGQLIAYNMLDLSKSFEVTKTTEHCFKCFFARDCLFMAVKENQSEYVSFFAIPVKSLQSSSAERKSLMKDLKITQTSVQEIDPISLKLVAEKDGNIQVWDLIEEKCIACFPKSPGIHYQVTSDFFVFWETSKSETKIGVLKLDKTFSTQFSVHSNQQLYLCKAVNDELILGFSGCNLQVINLKCMNSRVIKKGVPVKYYELEKTGKPFFMFSDFSCFLNCQDEKVLQVRPSQDHYLTELCDQLIICGSDGRLGVFSETVEYLPVQFSEVQQVGSNPDSGQVLVACKGRIWVVE